MQILDNLIILALIVTAFVSGMKVSDAYNRKIKAQQEYATELLACKNGYIAKPEARIEKRKVHIGQPFMDALLKNGRAVQGINIHR